ncbi:hypothetical protein HOK51_08645 [Candidatus Woesearchaeota archaeon]|nr:hypothetical protein [Candidatus Woesearchaeota archaeon]MBT6519895.1 hypothetical protein [Candidatus Woesearchaeota archaeon]
MIFVVLLVFNSIFVFATDIDDCSILSSPGLYMLNTSLTDESTDCITITSSNVHLDCQNNLIDGQNANSGIVASASDGSEYTNLSITNCNVTQFSIGIEFDYVDHSNISSVYVFGNADDGMNLNNIDNLTIKNSNISANTDNGIEATNSADILVLNNNFSSHSGSGDVGIYILNTGNSDWNVSDNTFSGNYYGLYYLMPGGSGFTFSNNIFDGNTDSGVAVYYGDNGIFRDNIFTNNKYGINIKHADAEDNEFYNNQINDSTTYAINFGSSSMMDQIFEGNTVGNSTYLHCSKNHSWQKSNYVITDNKISNQGSVNLYYCNNSVLNNITVLNADTYGLESYYSNNVTISSSEFSAAGNDGVYVDNSNITIQHSTISDNVDNGIELHYADGTIIFNTTVSGHSGSSDIGIYITGDDNDYCNISQNNFSGNYYGVYHHDADSAGISVSDNRFEQNTKSGVMIYSGDNAVFRNNVFVGNYYGVDVSHTNAEDNEFYDNQFNGSTTYAIRFGSVSFMDQIFSENLVDGYEYFHCYNNHSWSAENSNIETVKVTNYGSLNIYSCNNSIVSNITATNNSADGLYISTSFNITVSNSNFSYNTDDGIEVEDSNNLTFQNSVLLLNTDNGMEANDCDSVFIIGLNVSNQSGSGDIGIYINSNNNYWNVSDSNFTGNYYGLYYNSVNGVGNYIGNNFFYDNLISGIHIYYGDNAVINDNDFTSNKYGVNFANVDSGSNLVYRNNFKSSTTDHATHLGTNHFNSSTTLGGNYWDDFDQVGEGCSDGNSDGFCDATYNTSGLTPATDYLPYAQEVNHSATQTQSPTTSNISVTAVQNQSIIEGSQITINISFTQSISSSYNASVNWSDGTAVSMSLNVSSPFSLNHTFYDDGTFTVNASIVNESGTGFDLVLIEVNNSAPTIEGNISYLVELNTLVTLNLNFSDLGVNDTHSLDIDWNDTQIDQETLTSDFVINNTHNYTIAGNYSVLINVTDSDGASTTQNVSVNVTNSTGDVCGDGAITGVEVCDGTNFTTTCSAQGFDGGSLTCAGDCLSYSTSSCTTDSGGGGFHRRRSSGATTSPADTTETEVTEEITEELEEELEENLTEEIEEELNLTEEINITEINVTEMNITINETLNITNLTFTFQQYLEPIFVEFTANASNIFSFQPQLETIFADLTGDAVDIYSFQGNLNLVFGDLTNQQIEIPINVTYSFKPTLEDLFLEMDNEEIQIEFLNLTANTTFNESFNFSFQPVLDQLFEELKRANISQDQDVQINFTFQPDLEDIFDEMDQEEILIEELNMTIANNSTNITAELTNFTFEPFISSVVTSLEGMSVFSFETDLNEILAASEGIDVDFES